MLLQMILMVLLGISNLSSPMLPQPIQLINTARNNAGLDSVRIEQGLNESAYKKCQHMIRNNYWEHSGGGAEWYDFVWNSNPSINNASEILAKGYKDDISQHKGWMNSKLHHDAIVNKEYTMVGMAECKYKSGERLTVVHFGGRL